MSGCARRGTLRTRFGSFGAWVLMLAVAALGVRLFYILVIAPIPVGVGGDASFYHTSANLLAKGHFYYRQILGRTEPTALHPPLYSMLLSVVAVLGGVTLLPQRVVGCVIGAASVALIAVLGRRVAGPRAGAVAGGIAAVYPPLVTADGSLQSEPVYVLLLLVVLLLAERLARGSSVRRLLALGAVIGLATLARTEGLLLLPLLAWPLAIRPARGRLLRLAGVTVACAAVLAPWVTRNAVVFHKLMLAGNYDTVVSAANCHTTYYGSDIGWWSLRCLERARTPHQFFIGDASPSPGFHYIGRHPARAVLVAGVRVLRTFSFYQPLRIGNHEPRRQWFDAFGLVLYYPMLALAAIGLGRLPGRRWLLAVPVVLALFVGATGWGNARFRIGADVSLIVLAGSALSQASAYGRGSNLWVRWRNSAAKPGYSA